MIRIAKHNDQFEFDSNANLIVYKLLILFLNENLWNGF